MLFNLILPWKKILDDMCAKKIFGVKDSLLQYESLKFKSSKYLYI